VGLDEEDRIPDWNGGTEYGGGAKNGAQDDSEFMENAAGGHAGLNDLLVLPESLSARECCSTAARASACGELPELTMAMNAGAGGKTATKRSGSAQNDTDASRCELPSASIRTMRHMWRIWCTLVVLSCIEFLLLVTAAGLDLFWSPCREALAECHSLHVADCSGTSCRDTAPIWAPAWPVLGLVFVAAPLRSVLRCGGGAVKHPRCLLLALIGALALAGAGVVVVMEAAIAGLHYGSRCPIERASARCADELCPSPPCRRETVYSPCECGRLAEAEMARALFLNDFPACHPYEWYPRQMGALEGLMARYESVACALGPLACAAGAAGAALLLAQLACCPLLLLGRWGVGQALIVLFASEEERVITIEVPPERCQGVAGPRPTGTPPPPPGEPGTLDLFRSGADARGGEAGEDALSIWLAHPHSRVSDVVKSGIRPGMANDRC